jgi:hypothetical protein
VSRYRLKCTICNQHESSDTYTEESECVYCGGDMEFVGYVSRRPKMQHGRGVLTAEDRSAIFGVLPSANRG